MSSVLRALAGFALACNLASGSPIPETPVYFQRDSYTPRQISVSQIQSELGPQLSRGSVIVGPSDSAYAGFTKRYVVYSSPQDVQAVIAVNAESDVAKVVKYCNSKSVPWLGVNRGHGFTDTINKLNGVEINLSQLTKIDVQRNRRSAWLQGGLSNEEVIDALDAQRLITTTGANTCVGVLGPALGGGFGRTQGLYGLISDNIIQFKAVLADGREVIVSDRCNQDLWWALRGAGHNFAIVTSIELKVYPRSVDTWHYHNYVWTQDKLEKVFDTLNKVQGVGKTPAKMAVSYGTISINQSYSSTEPLLTWTFSYMGSATEGERAFKPFSEIGALYEEQGDVSYRQLFDKQGTGGENPDGTCGSYPLVGRNANLQVYNATAERAIYNLLVDVAKRNPSLAAYARVFHESYSTLGTQAVRSDSSAYPHRDEYLVMLFSVIAPPELKAEAQQFADQVRDLWNAGQPTRKPTTYVNYATGGESLESMYGYDSWRLQRLRSLKAKYDPYNRFRYYNPIVAA